MSVILHLSDPHFGTERLDVCNALLTLARQLAPDAIILSGDLTQRATCGQFAAAADFVQALPAVPRLILTGNHDIPLFNPLLRLFAPYRRHARHFGTELEPQLDLDGVQISSVNTTRRWRHQFGAISRGQIQRVAQRLQTARADDWKIVVTHHPLLLTPGAQGADRPLRHAEALRVWCKAGAGLFLNGHVHRTALLPVGAPASGAAPAFVAQAGTACSARLRGGQPNSVTVLRQSGSAGYRQRSLEYWQWDESAGAFAACAPLSLVLPAASAGASER